jgi:hypothetical protein
MIRIEMKVDDVKQSQKGLDSCILKLAKEDTTIEGVEVDVTVTIKADGVDLFEDLGIGLKGQLIDLELKDPAQTTLGE